MIEKFLTSKKIKNKRQLLENPQNPNTGGNFLSFTSIFTCSSKSVGAGGRCYVPVLTAVSRKGRKIKTTCMFPHHSLILFWDHKQYKRKFHIELLNFKNVIIKRVTTFKLHSFKKIKVHQLVTSILIQLWKQF